MELYGSLALNALLSAVNGFLFWRGTSRLRWFSLGAAIVAGLAAVLLAVGIFGNIAAGCTPWSPKQVEFQQGMTLCPGQSASFSIGVQ